MRGMRAFVVAACLGTLSAQASPSPAAPIANQLASEQPISVAQGAQAAAQSRDKAMARPLLQALTKWRTSSDEHARLTCLYLLDALIELDARVTPADLVPLVDDDWCAVQAFVLLAREPRHHEAELMAIFRRDWPTFDRELGTFADLRTLAIGNLLAAQGPPGFASLLLGEVDLDVHITIVDSLGAATLGPRAAGARAGVRDRGAPLRRAAPKGWPLRPHLSLLSPRLRSDGARVRTPATMRVQAVRIGKVENADVISLAIGHDEPPLELRWLATIAGLAIPSVPRRMMLDDASTFADVVVRAREQQQVFVDVLRRELVDRRALTTAEASPLDYRVVARLSDDRIVRAIAVPTIPAAR